MQFVACQASKKRKPLTCKNNHCTAYQSKHKSMIHKHDTCYLNKSAICGKRKSINNTCTDTKHSKCLFKYVTKVVKEQNNV